MEHDRERRQSEERDEDQDQAERPRFGIGSLINRMSRNDIDKINSPGSWKPKDAIPVSENKGIETESDSLDAEQERIEVPAFLRRQAN